MRFWIIYISLRQPTMVVDIFTQRPTHPHYKKASYGPILVGIEIYFL